MDYKTSRKPRPKPLKDVQIAVQVDEPRRYLVLDAHSSLPSPAYPVERQGVPPTPLSPWLQEDPCAWQARAPVSNGLPVRTPPCFASHWLDSLSSTPSLVQTEPGIVLSSSTQKDTINYAWDDSPNSQDDNRLDVCSLHSTRPYRSFTPPISPPLLSLPGIDAAHSSKRSGMTFALVPAEVDGMHVFTHVVVNPQDNDSLIPPSNPSEAIGLPEDMRDILQQLDDLANWVKATSSSRDCTSSKSTSQMLRFTEHPGIGTTGDGTRHLTNESLPDKGKNRLLSTSPPYSEGFPCRDFVEPMRGSMPGNSTNVSPGADYQSEGFIYVPNCNTPEFLVGSSNSPIAYPVCGYSSHPSRQSPHPAGPTTGLSSRHRFLERRSAPCPTPTSLVSPPLGKTSFKTLFQRSRCNTTVGSRPVIPSGHVPVENALRQGKRMRLPWLRI